jgi:hypothetical protein
MHGHRDRSQHTPTLAAAQTKKEEHSGCCCASSAPSHDAIAHRAYDIYVKAGSKQGHCKQNWQQAETELQAVGLVG